MTARRAWRGAPQKGYAPEIGDPAGEVSVREDLALEAGGETKHEYLNGIVVAMAGASPRHHVIAANLARRLLEALTRPRAWSSAATSASGSRRRTGTCTPT